jgi:hypothetical protein
LDFGSRRGNPAGSNRWGLPFLELDGRIALSSDRPEKYAYRSAVAGVPPLRVCEERAADALKAAEETKLSNVRELYSRSALRWSELAEQKIIHS